MKVQWSTVDRTGTRVLWPSEDHARRYLENRIKIGNAKPGEEKVLKRTVSEWKEVK